MLIQLVATAVALSASAGDGRARSAAVDTITAGHPSLRGKTFRLGTDTMEVFIEREGKLQLVQTGIQEISNAPDGVLVVFLGRGRDGLLIDSVLVSPTTFAPIRHVEAFPNGKGGRYAFSRGRVTGASTDSTGEHKVDSPIRDGVFDFSVVQQVTAVLPFAAGYEAVVLSYDVAQKKERAVAFRVVGEERLTIRGQDYSAWKTIMKLDTHEVTRWIDPKTRRDLKVEVSLPNMHMVGLPK
jgi:hypothetical protein